MPRDPRPFAIAVVLFVVFSTLFHLRQEAADMAAHMRAHRGNGAEAAAQLTSLRDEMRQRDQRAGPKAPVIVPVVVAIPMPSTQDGPSPSPAMPVVVECAPGTPSPRPPGPPTASSTTTTSTTSLLSVGLTVDVRP